MDCVNEDDEGTCTFINEVGASYVVPPPPPAVIDFVKNGSTIISPLASSVLLERNSSVCPETHYQCLNNGYCLPVFTRCNKLYDCPFHEDEENCESYTCPGHYRCFEAQVCLHYSHVCDGIYQCPRSDDELLCGFHCPTQCHCHGLAFTCSFTFQVDLYPDLRYLNAAGSSMTLERLSTNTMLVYVSMADCDISSISNVSMPNVNILDLSDNKLTYVPVSILHTFQSLRIIFLSGNLLSTPLPTDISFLTLERVHILDLSMNKISLMQEQFLLYFPSLQILNLSQCGTHHVSGQGFQVTTTLRVLDTRGCPMSEIQRGIFQGLDQLDTVYADSYKLCCVAALLEGFNQNNCHAPEDEISSCQDLLRSNSYRVLLAIFNTLALLGNGVSFVFRLSSMKKAGSQGFSVFVLHLCVSDFLMGIYLTVIGIADRLYQNSYVWKDTAWRHSPACQMAGFLSLVSCEVSAFIICLITLDRFLVVRFPLSFLHFKGWNAQLASCLSWLVGVIMAAVPLLPAVAHWHFYSQTGICIPLPVTRKLLPGHQFSFGVMIILNFILFLVIAVGQLAIYFSVRSNTLKASYASQCSQETSIAQRLFIIAMSDFLCWFPIGLIGLLAFKQIPISGEINVALAIIVMPMNSALNPFLYTVNIMLERRRRVKEQTIVKWIESQKRSPITT